MVGISTGAPNEALALVEPHWDRWVETFGARHPRLLRTAINRSEALFLCERTEEAREMLESVLDNAAALPRVAVRASNNLAGQLMRAGDLPGAVRQIERAVEFAGAVPAMLLEEGPRVMINYYGMSAKLGDDPARTIAAGSRLMQLELGREQPNLAMVRGIRRTLAGEHEKLGNDAAAIEAWNALLDERTYRDQPQIEVQLVESLSRALERVGRTAQARSELASWLERLPAEGVDPAVLEPLRERLALL